MVETGIFCGSADVARKAGAGASATALTDTYTNDFISQAESFINSAARYNFSDAYGSLNADTKGILKEAASNMAAIYVINYNMGSYTSRIEAEDKINVLRDIALRDIALLKDKKTTDFIREV